MSKFLGEEHISSRMTRDANKIHREKGHRACSEPWRISFRTDATDIREIQNAASSHMPYHSGNRYG